MCVNLSDNYTPFSAAVCLGLAGRPAAPSQLPGPPGARNFVMLNTARCPRGCRHPKKKI